MAVYLSKQKNLCGIAEAASKSRGGRFYSGLARLRDNGDGAERGR